MAQWLGLDDKIKEDEIKIRFPDEITAVTREVEVTGAMLDNGAMLKDITFPSNTLVVMVKRDKRYLVPTGSTELHLGDRLFIVAESENCENNAG